MCHQGKLIKGFDSQGYGLTQTASSEEAESSMNGAGSVLDGGEASCESQRCGY
jgi:hypothetical protein